MRPVKKLRPIPLNLIAPAQKALIPREEALAALTIYFLSKNMPSPFYRDVQIKHSAPNGPITRHLNKMKETTSTNYTSTIRVTQNTTEINSARKKLANLEKQFLEGFGYTWQTTSDEIWGYLKDEKPNLAMIPQEVYDAYVKQVSINASKDEVEKEPVNNNITRETPIVEDKKGRKSYWIYKGYEYEVSGSYSDEECRFMILEDFDKERRYFEKLKAKFDNTQMDIEYERPRIPENVRIEVWRRDGGKCARCGSREKLEYDHIVPLSKGGSNTARNIELLCEKHNRSKSNNVV